MIIYACARGDRQGVRVVSGGPLVYAAGYWGTPDLVRCLIKEVGANVEEQCDGVAPVYLAAQEGNADIV
jgi:hypothetical protein